MKIIGALLALALLAAPAAAQDKYPSQRLNWIIAFGPGGGNDIMARTLISILEKYKLYLNLVWLLGEVGGQASDVAGGVGYRPTNASQGVFRDLSQQLEMAGTDFSRLMREIEAFNRAHAGRIAPINDRLPSAR